MVKSKFKHKIDSSKLIKPTEVYGSIQSCSGPFYISAMRAVSNIATAIDNAGFQFSLIDDGNAKLAILCGKEDKRKVLNVIDNFLKA